MKKKTAAIWANGVNLAGLMSPKPIRMTWHEQLKEWYDKHGNISIEKLGLDVERGPWHCTYFASYSRRDVMLWTEGAKAVVRLLRHWAHD